VTLFREVFPAVISLALLLPEESGKGDSRGLFLDRILREGILSPLGHFPTPSSYPNLATLIVSHIPVVSNHMGIDTVKHLPDVLPLLSAILQEPFVLSHQPLVASALRALQSVMFNAWPRLPGHRGIIMMGLCSVWIICSEEESSGSQPVEQVKAQVQETVAILDAVMQSVDEAGLVETWTKEKQDLVGRRARFEEMFGQSVEKMRPNKTDAS
jgi:tRNA nucleotidyltransferase (CCA-adding enzyme)